MRRLILSISFLACLPATSAAQHVLFEEDFEGGVPATWTNVYLSNRLDPWQPGFSIVDGSKDVLHEYYCTNGFVLRDNLLLSPVIDLSGVSQAYFDCSQFQRLPTLRSYNGVEITTDGGLTRTEIYRETGAWTGFGTIHADISAWAGMSNVQIGFHYRGTVANEWSVDNVRVTTSPLHHTVTGLVANSQATLAVTGAMPGSMVVVIASDGPGPMRTPWGNLNLAAAMIVLQVLVADGNGNASWLAPIPAGTTGRVLHTQGVELELPSTLRFSNSVALGVQ